MIRTHWHPDNTPIATTLDKLLYDIRKDDGEDGLIFDALSFADISEDADGRIALDAMLSPYNKLEAKMTVLQKVMERAGTEIKPVAHQLSEPFTQHGSANVACIFELTDGQTISVFFHNPDTTPKKILPTDEMVSWKWLLNKKDITIVVAPEKGKDLNVRQVATRLMKLAEKNSASFQRQNSKRAEKMQAINGLKTEIAGLEQTLKAKQHELEAIKVEKEIRAIDPVIEPAEEGDQETLNGFSVKETIDELNGEYSTNNDVWNAEPSEIQALSEKSYEELCSALTKANYHSDNTLLQAKRNGNSAIIEMAEQSIREDNSDKSLAVIYALGGADGIKEGYEKVAYYERNNRQERADEIRKYLDILTNKQETDPEPTVDWSKIKNLDTQAEIRALGIAMITDIGDENVYVIKDGKPYYFKPLNTDNYAVGEHDFSNDDPYGEGEQSVNVDGLDYTPIDLSADNAKQVWDKAILETDGNEFKAAKNVYQKTLQGHYVNTSIGKVLISGYGFRKIREGLNKDSLRAKTVPYIAAILKEGSVGAFDPNRQLDKKPDVTGYYPFTKTLEIDKKLVTAVLKVEQKEKGELVYHLRTTEDSTFDSIVFDTARRPKFNPKTDRWVSTETGTHLMIRGDKVVAGAGGTFNGKSAHDVTAKRNSQTINGHSVKDTITELSTKYGTNNDVWNASIDEVKSLHEDDFKALAENLDDANYYSESMLLRTKRTGNEKLIKFAEKSLSDHTKARNSNAKSRNDKLQVAASRFDAMNTVLLGKEAIKDRIAEANKSISAGHWTESEKTKIKTLNLLGKMLDSVSLDQDDIVDIDSMIRMTLDGTNENASLLRFMPDSLAFQRSETPTLDSSVETNTGGVNIIILKVTDLEGNEITELEDKIEQETNGQANEQVTPTSTGIDPVAKSNIEAANISAAIKKKAIAYLNANPDSHEIKGISAKSLSAIMESIKTAFISEVMSLSDKFTVSGTRNDQLALSDDKTVIFFGFTPDDTKATGWRVDFSTFDKTSRKSTKIFDSTQTLEDLRAWGFALPFDLDVKAFVANVIKPVVDEFLSKAQTSETETETPQPEPTPEPQPETPQTQTDMEETAKIATPEEITEFISDIAQEKKPKAERLVVNVASHDKNIKVKNLTDVDIGVARELLIPSAAVHVKNRHPDMEISDWLYLPEFAEKFDAVVESKTVGTNKLPRLVFIKNKDGLAYVYIADLATGKRQGDRLNLVTYFKDKPTKLIESLQKNGVKQEDAESVLNALFFNDESSLSQAYSQRSEEGDSSDQLTASDETIPNPPPNATDDLSLFIKIAADSIEKLRKADVYRVLESAPKEKMNDLAAYIMSNKPDLMVEVEECLSELNAETTPNATADNADIEADSKRRAENGEITLTDYRENMKKVLGNDYKDFAVGVENDWYELLEKHLKAGGKVTQEIVDSMTDGQRYHFAKHYNSRNDAIIKSDVSTPAQNDNANIEAEIESLKQLIGMPEFSDALDALLDKLEAAGLDSQYETVVSDIIIQDAQAESAKVGI